MRQRAAAGKPVPALKNKPELFPNLAEVWSIWRQLHNCRQTGWGLSPLSARDIIAVLELYDVYDKRFYFELILALDQAWLAWAAEQQEHKAGGR